MYGVAARLVAPDVAYEASDRAYVAQIVAVNEHVVPFTRVLSLADFLGYVSHLAARACRSPGFVPNSTFYLVDEDEILVVSNLCRRLRQLGEHISYGVPRSQRGWGDGKLLLRLTLEEARR